MNIQEPLFAVGEVVIVSCHNFPHYDGEHTVREVMQRGDVYFDRLANQVFRTMPPPTASLYGYQMDAVLEDDDGFEVIYDQSCLRKKHQPGELSFEELVNEHKEPA